MRLVAGQIIAERYRLDRPLGEGGMGVVWAATHTITERAVALKFLRGLGASRPEMVARFLLEAKVATAVNHPNVVEVIDIFLLDGATPVMVLSLLEGKTLRDRLAASGRLPLSAVARVMLPVLSAVAAAHAKGIVHRDLKPENIFLARSRDGTEVVKVLDFGIAKLVSAHETAGDAALTETGAMIGTPAYMAPEQLFSQDAVDARADLWALGAITYELVTGQRPLLGSTVGQLVKSLMSDGVTPLSHRRPDLPADLTAAVMQMLEREPERRTPDTRLLAQVLEAHQASTEAIESAPTVSTPQAVATSERVRMAINTATPDGLTQLEPRSAAADASPRPRRGARRWLAAGAVGLAVIGGAGWVMRPKPRPQATPSTAPSAAPSAAADRPIVERRVEGVEEATLSPDGTSFAYLSGGKLLVRSVDGADKPRELPLPAPDAVLGLAYTRDGKSLLLASPSTAWRTDAATGRADVIARGEMFERPMDCAGGVVLHYTSGLRLLTPTGESRGLGMAHPSRVMAVSPSGRHLALVTIQRSDSGSDVSLDLFAVDGSARWNVTKDARLAFPAGTLAVLWPENNRVLYALRSEQAGTPGAELWEQRLDGEARPTGPARRRHGWPGVLDLGAECSASGRCSVVRAYGDYDVYVADLGRAGERVTPRRLKLVGGNELLADFTPEGEIVFFSDRDGSYDLFRTRSGFGIGEPLVSSPASETFAELRDGNLLYWELPKTDAGVGPLGNWMLKPLSAAPPVLLLEAQIEVGYRSYVLPRHATFRCPHHRKGMCVLRSAVNGREEFSWFDLKSRTSKAPFHSGPFVNRISWAVSPDGELLALADGSRLKVVSTRTGAVREQRLGSFSSPQSTAWSHDGKKIFVTAWAGSGWSIVTVVPPSGETHELWSFDPNEWPAYLVASSDGRMLGFSGLRRHREYWLVEGL